MAKQQLLTWGGASSVLLLLTFLPLLVNANPKPSENKCDSAERHARALGVQAQSSPKTRTYEYGVDKFPADHMWICHQGQKCCDRDMERHFSAKCKQDFTSLYNEVTYRARHSFVQKSKKFDVFFKGLLSDSRDQLHQMFMYTYGLLYQKNTYMFERLFDDLEKYYKGSDLNLNDVMKRFFESLLHRAYYLITESTRDTPEFPESHLRCIGSFVAEFREFDEVPELLATQVRRSLIATRTFFQALVVGRAVLTEMSKVEPTHQCNKALTKLLYCPSCQGINDVKPCHKYCVNVMKGCMAFHAELQAQWGSYITHMLKLAERLEGPYNVETVIKPLNVKISDVIMNFQEKGLNFTQKVQRKCPLERAWKDRSRRAADGAEGDAPDGKKKNKKLDNIYDAMWRPNKKNRGNGKEPVNNEGLLGMLREVKQQLQRQKELWTKLPLMACENEVMAAPSDNDDNCWNGINVDRYRPDVIGEGVAGNNNNPEVEVDPAQKDPSISQHLYMLQTINDKLQKAYDAKDVTYMQLEIHDTTETEEESASQDLDGSGSGSGHGKDDEEGPELPLFPSILLPSSPTHGDDEDTSPAWGGGGDVGSGKGEIDEGKDSHEDVDERRYETKAPHHRTRPQATPSPRPGPAPEYSTKKPRTRGSSAAGLKVGHAAVVGSIVVTIFFCWRQML